MAARRSHLTLLLIVIAALAGVALLGVPGSPAHRKLLEGLDIQGGTQVVLQAKPAKGQQLTSQMMDNSISIMRTRVDKLGVSEPLITKQGTDQIVIELPAVHNPTQAASVIGQTAVLELYDLTPSLYGPSIDAAQNPVAHEQALRPPGARAERPEGPALRLLPLRLADEEARRGPEQSLAALKRDPVVQKLQPQKAKKVTVHTKASKGKPAKTSTKVVPPGKTTPGFPTGYQVMTAPNRTAVITCDSRRRGRMPRPARRPRCRGSSTTTSSSTASIRATRTAPTRR